MVTSPDGEYVHYSYCPAQRCGGNAQALIIQSCSKEAGEPCYLLGSRNTLLWHYADNIPGDDLARTFSVHKDDTAKVDLYQASSSGGVGSLLGLAYIPH